MRSATNHGSSERRPSLIGKSIYGETNDRSRAATGLPRRPSAETSRITAILSRTGNSEVTPLCDPGQLDFLIQDPLSVKNIHIYIKRDTSFSFP